MQAFPFVEHIDIIQPRCQFLTVLADIPVEPFEPLPVFYPIAARHEHDMVRLSIRLQGGHARLEELDAVSFAILEQVE